MKKEVASFTRRVFAYLIDLFIINILILRPFKLFLTTPKFGLFAFSKELMIVGVSVSILTLLYWALLEYTVRQSLGKMITRIYVAPLKKQLTLTQCLIRNVTKIVSIVLFLDVLYAFINKTHQRYFEILSNTEVLKVKEKK